MSSSKGRRSTLQESQKLIVKGKQSAGKSAFNTERNSFIEITYYKQNWQPTFADFHQLKPPTHTGLWEGIKESLWVSTIFPSATWAHPWSLIVMGTYYLIIGNAYLGKSGETGLVLTTSLTCLKLINAYTCTFRKNVILLLLMHFLSSLETRLGNKTNRIARSIQLYLAKRRA